MHQTNRREFLLQVGALAFAAPLLTQSQTYDLLIAGGRVIDPSQKLSAERDVAVSNGKIARIAPGIPTNQARQVLDAKGKFVTPGWIDVHGHVYDGIDMGIFPDVVGIPKGVTTIVDAGTTGSFTFPGFRKDRKSTRLNSSHLTQSRMPSSA